MRSRWLWTVPLVGMVCVTGCTKEAITSPDKAPSAIFTYRESNKPGPPRQPQAETCARAGGVLEHGGDSAKDPATRQQQYEKARMAYEQALSIDPKNRTSLIGLARVQSKQGNHPRAVESYRAAVQVNPNDAELWHEFGMCWGRQKQWDQAIPALYKAVSLDPRNAIYSNNYGWTLARAGQFQDSFEHFCRTVGEARAHYNLARMAQHLGQTNLSRQYAEAALRVDPQLAEAQQLLAQLDEAGDPNIRQTVGEAPH